MTDCDKGYSNGYNDAFGDDTAHYYEELQTAEYKKGYKIGSTHGMDAADENYDADFWGE